MAEAGEDERGAVSLPVHVVDDAESPPAMSLPPMTAPVRSNVPPPFRSFSRQQSQMTYRPLRPQRKPISGSSKWNIVRQTVQKSVVDFFGVGDEDDETKEWNRHKWRNRSLMLHHNRLIGGRVKRDTDTDSLLDGGSAQPSPGPATAPVTGYDDTDGLSASHASSGLSSSFRRTPHPVDPYSRHPMRQDSRGSRPPAASRQQSRISTASSSRRSMKSVPRSRSRKDSVFKMAYEGLTGMAMPKRPTRQITRQKSSFAPVVHDEPPASLKSPTEDSVYLTGEDLLDDVFFDTPTPTSVLATPGLRRRVLQPSGLGSGPSSGVNTPESLATITERVSETKQDSDGDHAGQGFRKDTFDFSGEAVRSVQAAGDQQLSGEGRAVSVRVEPDEEHRPLVTSRELDSGWTIPRSRPDDKLAEDEVDFPFEGLARMKDTFLETTLDNSDRREIGKGVIGDLLNREYKPGGLEPEIQEQIDEMVDHRPYFTYWACVVQIIVYIVSVCVCRPYFTYWACVVQIIVYIVSVAVYGIAPIGLSETQVEDEVILSNLALQKVSYMERDNLWIGPRQADLIHLGAKYSPCMRKDANVEAALAMDRQKESQTACCIRNDGSGCVQTSRDHCTETLSLWFKWSNSALGPNNYTSGSVCGQDPRTCQSPASIEPYEWPNDITRWPICTKSMEGTLKHTVCEVTGRPCCTGIQGECIITTREHCTFLKGYFHEEAALCSQVKCMNEICGMIPFLDPDKPDQFYRLFTAPFLHAGLIQLVISVLFQFFIMRDIERLAGWLRIAIIYIGSGIAGSLSSAIFLPYYVEAGPAGAQFGLLACLVVEVLQNWHLLDRPWLSLGKLLVIIIVLFIVGLFPFVDNYAHLIGLVLGFLLSFALLPHVTFNVLDRRAKTIGIIICLFVCAALIAMLVVLFYVSPVYSCPYCHYFNCIPINPTFCKGMEVKIGRDFSYQ